MATQTNDLIEVATWLPHETIRVNTIAEVQALVRLIRTARALDRVVILDLSDDEDGITVGFTERESED